MLRPESRGEVTTLTPGQSGPFVLLECDVPLEARNISWELRRAGSDEILRHGVAKAPEPGATLKLLIPSSVLAVGRVHPADRINWWRIQRQQAELDV